MPVIFIARCGGAIYFRLSFEKIFSFFLVKMVLLRQIVVTLNGAK